MKSPRAAALLLLLLLAPAVTALHENRVLNGDFEQVGDSPLDIPFWTADNGIAAARIDRLGSQGDAVVVVQGTTHVRTDHGFPVTTGETIVFSFSVKAPTSNARAMLQVLDQNSVVVGTRSYDIEGATDWTSYGTGDLFLVPAGAITGRVLLAAFPSSPHSLVPTPPAQSPLAMFDNIAVSN